MPDAGGCKGSVGTSYAAETGCALVISTQPSGWAAQKGALRIGPASDATKGHPAGKDGNFVYTLTFPIAMADFPTAKLTMSVPASPDVDISVNGNFIPAHTNTSTQRSLTPDLVVGTNTIQFFVSDIRSGPVGLNVLFGGDIGRGGSPLPSKAQRACSID